MPTEIFFLNREKFSGTIDQNFLVWRSDRKSIKVTGSGLWPKRVKGSSDLSK